MPYALLTTTLFLVVAASACGGSPEDSGSGCGIAPVVFDTYGTVQGENDDGDCARIERTATPLPPDTLCKACPYVLHRLVVERGDERFDVSDPARLEYEPTHHNWADVARAVTDDGRTVEVVFRYGSGELSSPESWTLDVTLLDEEGLVTGGPLSLPAVGGSAADL